MAHERRIDHNGFYTCDVYNKLYIYLFDDFFFTVLLPIRRNCLIKISFHYNFELIRIV